LEIGEIDQKKMVVLRCSRKSGLRLSNGRDIVENAAGLQIDAARDDLPVLGSSGICPAQVNVDQRGRPESKPTAAGASEVEMIFSYFSF